MTKIERIHIIIFKKNDNVPSKKNISDFYAWTFRKAITIGELCPIYRLHK